MERAGRSVDARRLVLALTLLFVGAASAHDADIVFVRADRDADGVVRERLTLAPTTLLWLAPIDEDGDGAVSERELRDGLGTVDAGVWDDAPLLASDGPCRRTSSGAVLRATFVELTATFACPGDGALTQRFPLVHVLPPGYRVVLGTFGDGGPRHVFADRGDATLVVWRAAPASPEGTADEDGRGFTGWVLLGVEHIFLGIDHLAFLLAVLLVGGGWKRTLLLVTSFTVAHSITLGATALGAWTLSPEWARGVEIAIALSIVWIAIENLVLRTHRHRAALTFGFGLVHGFGFASVLAGYGLGDSAALALFGFNLGVEVGQAAVVLLLAPLVWLASKRHRVHVWTVRAGSTAVLCAGAFWLVERALG